MKSLLICPAERASVRFLAETSPLVLVPILGQPLVCHWLEHLAYHGAKQVRVLATDRPEKIRHEVGDGRRWGLHVDVLPVIKELTPDEARVKYRDPNRSGWLAEPDDVILMDHLPGGDSPRLFDSYAGWVAGVMAWLTAAARRPRLGAREVKPGIWVGLRTQISPSAVLRAPCWLGNNVWVGPDVILGPRTVLEDSVVVEAASEVMESVVGHETFVGMLTEVTYSIACGSNLLNWRNGSWVRVPDRFILCSTARRQSRRKAGSVAGRLAALLCLVLTSPYAAWITARARWRGVKALCPQVAVRPVGSGAPSVMNTLVYYEFTQGQGWGRRWPQLWQVVRGDFAWVGNRPLSPSKASELSNDFERLWLAAPIGLVSLADAEGCVEAFGDEARAHASFYAVQASRRLNLSILFRVLANGIPNA